jgi:hypothetical protein
MRVILVVLLTCGVLYFFAPGSFWTQRHLAEMAAEQAQVELREAMTAVRNTDERSPDFEKVVMRSRKAAMRAFFAEAEYKKYLLRL